MTKKHFIILAESISNDIASPEERRAIAAAVIRVARELNPRFDKARFLAACDLQEEPCTG